MTNQEQIDPNEETPDGNFYEFRKHLEELINTQSMENASDTPDYILAQYLTDCLEAFDNAVNLRRDWHSNEKTKDWEKK